MSQADELERAVEQSHEALAAIIRGDVSGYAQLYSLRDDVTIGNPFGPFARGRDNVIATGEAAAARYHDGEIVGFETVASHVSDDLACVVEVERFRARVGDMDASAPVALRVTSLFRREDGGWRLVHRHADPITKPQPADSVIQR
ncbi:MAG TPA: DUF4440 domain-containing protein [Solirubrobacteraceae bacterium]|nr:DUF4440 domain-containing protein [Solirubrobacteraceae bacterium]